MCQCLTAHGVEKISNYGTIIEEIDYVLKSLNVRVMKVLNPLDQADFVKLEARLARKLRVLSKNVRSESVKEITELIKKVDLSNPQTIRGFVKGSTEALKGLDKATAKELAPVLRESIKDMYTMTKKRQADELFSQKKIASKGKVSTFGTRDKQVVKLMNKNQAIYVKSGVRKQIDNFDERSKKIFSDALREGKTRKQVQKDLTKAFGNTVNDPKYWNIVASAQLNRARNWSNLEAFKQAGIDEYEVLAVMDERTSVVCKEMNGKTFSVARQINILESVAGNPDPDALVERTPWLTTRKNEDGNDIVGIRRPSGKFTPVATDGKLIGSNKKVQTLGAGMPPYHGLCRTTVVAI